MYRGVERTGRPTVGEQTETGQQQQLAAEETLSWLPKLRSTLSFNSRENVCAVRGGGQSFVHWLARCTHGSVTQVSLDATGPAAETATEGVRGSRRAGPAVGTATGGRRANPSGGLLTGIGKCTTARCMHLLKMTRPLFPRVPLPTNAFQCPPPRPVLRPSPLEVHGSSNPDRPIRVGLSGRDRDRDRDRDRGGGSGGGGEPVSLDEEVRR